MKKTIILFSILALAGIFGCTKVGPAGPAGPQGPAGTAGTTIVAIDTFYVQTNQWVATTAGNYKLVLTKTDITSQIVNSGTINVFVKDYTISTAWFALDDVVAGGGSGYRYSFDVNTLTLYAENFASGVPRPLLFKAVLLK